MKTSLVFAAIAISFTSFTPYFVSGQEQFRELWSIGNWKGFVFTEGGYFDRCSAIVAYTDGTTLGFSVRGDASLGLRTTNQNFSFGGSDVPLRVGISIDGRAPIQIGGYSQNFYQAFFSLGQDYDLLRQLRRGLSMRITGDLGDRTYSLTNSSAALQRMTECIPRPPTAMLPPNVVIETTQLDPNINPYMMGQGVLFEDIVKALSD
jgi:hypothetical protein